MDEDGGGLSHIRKIIHRILGKGNADRVTEDDIRAAVAQGHEKGVLGASEAEMIQNIFEFDDKDAKDIMTHRSEIQAIDGEETLEEAIRTFNESHFSRFPVYLGSLDNIIGVIHMRDLFPFVRKTEDYGKKIRDISGLLRTAQFVPETHGLHTLFTQMQFSKSHLVIVLDEYGQTSGMITMEDILEEIVGNIFDEHDVEEKNIRKLSENLYLCDGMTPLLEIADELQIVFEEKEIETLSGFMIFHYGKIPKDHECFTVHAYGYRFAAVDVSERIVSSVRISLDENAKSVKIEDKN